MKKGEGQNFGARSNVPFMSRKSEEKVKNNEYLIIFCLKSRGQYFETSRAWNNKDLCVFKK